MATKIFIFYFIFLLLLKYVKNDEKIKIIEKNVNLLKNIQEMSNSNNYIKITYQQNVKYNQNNQFKNNYRYDISFLRYKNIEYSGQENIEIEANSKLEIYFSSHLTSLEHFFDSLYDINSAKINSIDFTYFDSSLIKSVNSMLYGCISLKSINLSNFGSINLINMSKMFSQCSHLESINLSNIKISNIINISNIFDGCKSLKVLDLSGVDVSNIQSIENLFDDTNLEYINLYETKISEEVKNKLQNLTINNSLIICQKEMIISNENIKNICCDYNYENHICQSNNYIILYFEEDVNYYGNFINQYRKNINYINNENTTIKGNEKFTIKAYSKLEIHILSNIISLSHFFNSLYDFNCEKIISIDLSHLNTSLVQEINHIFFGCVSLKSINLSNTDSAQLTTMKAMFWGCKKLESIDLSNFKTSNVMDISNIVDNCVSLKVLNLSGLDLSNVENADYLLENVDLEYIDMYNINASSILLTQLNKFLSDKSSLIVCQNQNLKIIDSDKNKHICCDYNYETGLCPYTSYIEVYYGRDTKYDSGFENINREGINFIYYIDSLYGVNDILNIESNSKIVIYFSSPMITLTSFFDSKYDNNVEKIISINFSNFNSSKIIDISNLFQGCTNLKMVNLSNFDTSNIVNMSKMFYGCKSLISINLSSFDTIKVTDMSYMFYECISLEIIDLSNFNMIECQKFNNIFSNIENIKYINLKNFKNDKIISQIFNKKERFFVCQKEEIIKNRYAYNCCDYNIESNECNIKESTIIDIDTSIQETSEIKLSDSIVPLSIITTTIPIINNDETLIVFLGINHFKLFNTSFQFYLYFISMKNTIFAKKIRFPIKIKYEQNSQSIEGICSVQDKDIEYKYQYFCDIKISTYDIIEIKIEPDFHFELQNNTTLIGISPYANKAMNNIYMISGIYDILSNSNIYILDNCTYEKYGKYTFNISGKIKDSKDKFRNLNLTLLANSKKNLDVNIKCTFIHSFEDNYILNCKVNKSLEGNLQSSMCIINDTDILIINFYSDINPEIIIDDETKNHPEENIIKPGIIACIIIGVLILLAIIIFLILYIRKKKEHEKDKGKNDKDSSMTIIND